MNKVNTEQLVSRAKGGDKAAVDELYRIYSEPLMRFVMKQGLNEHDAQDVVSDTFMEMMKHINQLRENSYFSTWLHTIAKRKAGEHRKKASQYQRIDFDTSGYEDSDLSNIDADTAAVELAYEEAYGDTVMLPDDYAENEDTKRLIAEQIAALSDEHKEALFLFYYQNRSIAEIAELTNTNQNNVKARLFHARKNLKKKLESLRKNGVVFCAIPFYRFIFDFSNAFSGVAGAGAVNPFSSGAAQPTASGGAARGLKNAGKAAAASKAGTAAAAAGGTGIKAMIIAVAAGIAVITGGFAIKKAISSDDAKDKTSSSIAASITAVDCPASEVDVKGMPDFLDNLRNNVIGQDPHDVPEILEKYFGELDNGSKKTLDEIIETGDSYSLSKNYDKKPITILGNEFRSVNVYYCDGRVFQIELETMGYNDQYSSAEEYIDAFEQLRDDMDEGFGYEGIDPGRSMIEGGDTYLACYSPNGLEQVSDINAYYYRVLCVVPYNTDHLSIFRISINDIAVRDQLTEKETEPADETKTPSSPDELEGWRKAYYDYINEYVDIHAACDGISCRLFDVDGDDVPELFIDSYLEAPSYGGNKGNESVLVAYSSDTGSCNELVSRDENDPIRSYMDGGFSFTGNSSVIGMIVPVRHGAQVEIYNEYFYKLENGRFTKLPDEAEYEMNKFGFVFRVNGSDVDEESYMSFRKDLFSSSNIITTASRCPDAERCDASEFIPADSFKILAQ